MAPTNQIIFPLGPSSAEWCGEDPRDSTSLTSAVAADVQVSGMLDMRMNWITDLETDLNVYPVEPDHGATKKYVDTTRDEIVANLALEVDNGVF